MPTYHANKGVNIAKIGKSIMQTRVMTWSYHVDIGLIVKTGKSIMQTRLNENSFILQTEDNLIFLYHANNFMMVDGIKSKYRWNISPHSFRNRKVFSMNTGKVPDPTNDVEQESRRDLLTVDDFCIRNLQWVIFNWYFLKYCFFIYFYFFLSELVRCDLSKERSFQKQMRQSTSMKTKWNDWRV